MPATRTYSVSSERFLSDNRFPRGWKERQRIRVPSIDLHDNPFCVDRRLNEEWRTIQLNRNPSLANLTSADLPRTASFTVDHERSCRDFSRRKRQILVTSLDVTSGSERSLRKPLGTTVGKSKKMVSSSLEYLDINDFFSSREIPSSDRGPPEGDVDTLVNLEPYRREVVAQRPTTFGHRPASASRMFNPSALVTSSPINGRTIFGSHSFCSRKAKPRGTRIKHEKKSTARRGRKRRALGLSAPMLKELLSGKKQARTRGVIPPDATSLDVAGTKGDPSGDSKGRKGSPCGTGLSVTDIVDPWDRRPLKATSASQLGHLQLCMGKQGAVQLSEEAILRRIFSQDPPPWDGTPVPLPRPRDVRRPINTLSIPNADESSRDKLARSRKLAAGIPVTPSSTHDESAPDAQPIRWEAQSTTPRTFISRQELKRLGEMRRERDKSMARRTRRAERSALYKKIPPSEDRYQHTLAQAFKHQGLVGE